MLSELDHHATLPSVVHDVGTTSDRKVNRKNLRIMGLGVESVEPEASRDFRL